jgi:hypothetical protein
MGVLNPRTIIVSILACGLFVPPALVAQDAVPEPVQAPVEDASAVSPVMALGHTPLPGEAGSTVDKRAFGVLPNYRTADGSLPFSPITTKQKFTIATKDTVDGPSYVIAAFFSGISQMNNSNPSFGQGVQGYARRYASAIADQGIGNFMTEAIYPTLLHQDPRYFRKGSGSIMKRAFYAASRVLVTRTDQGNWRPNAAEILGNGTVAAVGNLYYPDGRNFEDNMQRMWSQIGTDAVSNILKEFWPDIKRHFSHKNSVGVAALN